VKGKKQVTKHMAIYGQWTKEMWFKRLQPDTEPELIWSKNPYHEKADFMYGLSHFSLQMNYFPKRLHNVVAPTDTRRRPDQRALENGDIKSASEAKNFLEVKQRAVRKYREGQKIEHEPLFFEPITNEADGLVYHVYNKKYFEVNRKQ
jgi:hypothetical protein